MRLLAGALAVGALILSVGCGATARTIDTDSALAVLVQNGFHDLRVVTGAELNRSACRQGVREACRSRPPDFDIIATKGYGDRYLMMPLTAARFPNVSSAKRRLENDRPLLRGDVAASDLPAGFELRRLREARVCNLVLDCYDAGRDRSLPKRFESALKELRRLC